MLSKSLVLFLGLLSIHIALWDHLGTMTMVTVTCMMATETGNNINVG